MLFSIIIPAYNAEATLAEAVFSAISQSLDSSQYEILIVDDGSTDGTWALMERLTEQAGNLRLFKNQKNMGQGASRNRALGEAKGEYITFLDADDLLRSDALELYALKVTGNQPEIVFANLLKINEYGDIIPLKAGRERHEVKNLKSRTVRGRRTFCAVGAIYRKNFMMDNGIKFSEGIYYEDIEFVIRAVFSATKVDGVEADLYYWRTAIGSSAMYVSLRKVNDAVAALELMPGLLEGFGVLSQYLDDWRYFVRRFINQTLRRLGEQAAGDSDLASLFLKRIETSEVFKKYSLDGLLDDQIRTAALEPEPLFLAHLTEAASGAVVMVANVDYQVRNFVAVARRLKALGVKNVVCDISGSKKFSYPRAISNEEAASYADINLFRFDSALLNNLLFNNARAYLVGADWGFFRPLVFTLRRHKIPVIGFYEGINDDYLLEPPPPPARKFLPYRNTEYLLLPGEYYKNIYARQKTTVVGLPAIRAFMDEETRFPERPVAVINVNFSYGVLEGARRVYLDSAVEACQRLGVDFVISQHPADKGDLSPWAVSKNSLYEEVRRGSLLISRFSTCILEALALGKPVIYHNPHNEKFPKFQEEPLGAFQVSNSTDELVRAIEKTLAEIEAQADIRAQAKSYLQRHANVFLEHPPEHYAALSIKNIIERDEENFQKRLLHFSAGKTPTGYDLPEPASQNLRLLWNYKMASWGRKVLVMLLLDRFRLKNHLLGKYENKFIRVLIKLIPE